MIEMFLIEKLTTNLGIEKIGKLPTTIEGVSTDSRNISENVDLFIGLTGPKFDGGSFIDGVYQQNVKSFVLQKNPENKRRLLNLCNQDASVSGLLVSDTTLFLQQLAKEHLNHWRSVNPKRRVVAITGSNGKTTHKEMLFYLLQGLQPGRVIATLGNFNNHIGVPLTLLRLTDAVEIIILEIGTNHPGEIKFLSDMVRPEFGLITNIGDSHLEFFGDRDGVFIEKRALFDAVISERKSKGLFFLNMNDRLLAHLPISSNVTTFGDANDGQNELDYTFTVSADSVKVCHRSKEYLLKNDSITGRHMFWDLAVAFMMALSLEGDKSSEKLMHRVTDFRPGSNRGEWITRGTYKIYLDAYNANPSSMRSSVDGFIDYIQHHAEQLDKAFFVIGEMKELGPKSPQYHEDLGAFFRMKQIKNICYIGNYASEFHQGLGHNCLTYQKVNNLSPSIWEKILKDHSYFYIKGSRSHHLEEVLQLMN